MGKPVKLSAADRDVLYGTCLDSLCRLPDLWMEIDQQRFEDADRLAREVIDDLRLILDGLGWGQAGEADVELMTPPEVLRRAMSRHCDAVLHREATEVPERVEARREMQHAEERNRGIIKICQRILAELDLGDALTQQGGN